MFCEKRDVERGGLDVAVGFGRGVGIGGGGKRREMMGGEGGG